MNTNPLEQFGRPKEDKIKEIKEFEILPGFENVVELPRRFNGLEINTKEAPTAPAKIIDLDQKRQEKNYFLSGPKNLNPSITNPVFYLQSNKPINERKRSELLQELKNNYRLATAKLFIASPSEEVDGILREHLGINIIDIFDSEEGKLLQNQQNIRVPDNFVNENYNF